MLGCYCDWKYKESPKKQTLDSWKSLHLLHFWKPLYFWLFWNTITDQQMNGLTDSTDCRDAFTTENDKKNAQLWKGWVTLLNNIKFSNIHMNWCTPYQNDIYVINLSIIIFLEVELTADYSQRGIIIMGNFKKLCGRVSCVMTISFTFVTIICTIVMMYMIHFGRLKES